MSQIKHDRLGPEFDLGVPVFADEKRDRTSDKQMVERLRLLGRHRRFLYRFSAVGFVVAVLIALLIPSRYTSVVRLMPPDQDTGAGMGMLAAMVSKAGGSLGGLEAQILGLKTTGDLFVGILQSRTVQDSLITRFDLRKIYGIKHWDDTRKQLASYTTISQDRKNGILTIEVSDRSPQRAQEIAQAYVAELNQVVTSLNTSSAHRERVFLEERLKKVQDDLDSAERDFSQFASKNTTIDIQAEGKAMIEAGANLAGQLISAQTELEGLRQMYSANNVRVRATQARIDELRRQLQKFGGNEGTNATPAQDPTALYPPIRELPLLGVTYANLYRRMKVQETVFETLTQEYEIAKVQEAKETPSVKTLDPPDLPERKSSPQRLAIIFFGLVFACVLGIVLVFGQEHWREMNPEHPVKVLFFDVVHATQDFRTWGFPTPQWFGPTNGNGAIEPSLSRNDRAD